MQRRRARYPSRQGSVWLDAQAFDSDGGVVLGDHEQAVAGLKDPVGLRRTGRS
ncbi:MAG: hypothetical protein ACRDH9_11825 [Actinomycetota bacterium]